MTISFFVPCVPVAQPRQRHRIIASGSRSFVHNYTPAKHPVQDFKATCKIAANSTHAKAPLECPVCLTLQFILPRPSSTPKRIVDRVPHTKKPDIENLCKSVMDALTGVLFADDKQVFSLNAEKWIASISDSPGVFVTVKEF